MADDQPKEDHILEPGCDRQPDSGLEAEREGLSRSIAQFFEGQGSSPVEAQAQARSLMEELTRFGAGRSWGGLHAEGIPQIVLEAMRQGARRLVLEIEAEGEYDEWHGHLNITIKETQTWQAWDKQRQERAQQELN